MEIPPPIRDFKSAVVLLCAWLATKKPPRDHLLVPIITQLELLMRSEITLKQTDGNVFLMLTLCRDSILGSTLSYTVRIQQAIFDLPARAHFLNIVQYNGYDGCSDCCIKGEYLFRFKNYFAIFIFLGSAIGRQIYFPFSKKPEKLKDHQFYLQNSKYDGCCSIKGIKGPTPLSSILLLPNQTPYDSMHLIFHGHVKTLLKTWKEMFAKEVFENGSVLLSKVILPHSFRYQFFSLSDFSSWKAKMLRDFFLYVSPLFVINFLPDDYSAHFLLYYTFVKVLHFFTDKNQLIGIESLFFLYHESLSSLYSKRSELATIHYHSHLLSQVYSHGALCFTSCFSRESYLAHVLKWCKGTKYVLKQLVTWYDISQNIHKCSSFSLFDIFSKETFSPSYVDNVLIVSLHRDFVECLQSFSASLSDCIFYSRYFRGFVCFHSVCYTRRGNSISHFVSIKSASCARDKLCFASVLFYFSLRHQYYASVKVYPCRAQSILSVLQRTVPSLVEKIIDSYFRLFDESVFSFEILSVSEITKKAIKIPTLENNICSFTTVEFDFEHD